MTHCFHKSISLILTFLLLISLIGCSSSSSSKSETNDQKTKVTQAKNDKKQKDPTGETSKQVQAAGTTNQPNTANANTQAVAAKPETNQQIAAAKPSSPAQVAQPSKPKTTANTAPSQQTTSPAPVASAAPAAPVQTVKISITGPKDRPTILNLTTVNIKGNETILDVLLDAAGKNNIDVDKTGSGATAYVRGIDGIYERDYGAMSGWICKQNGTGIAKSAGAITVKAGDQIEWIYKEN
ncbi:DUF4430 domain-containing protein [Neobacillus sp. PS3-12]|uniref:DUF4430 domain-containing protein n=1 Tax=Neobacillus sp. PS3-12 TaxID=3070677 RepID=UPI0027DF9F9E|nr:DUF4430 domain-containing protein [Neobacillus sp. PS3-12]WML52834.1 DUF4430 domain-containing protein [Neobacillus sp. PS3-12]